MDAMVKTVNIEKAGLQPAANAFELIDSNASLPYNGR